VIYAIKTIVAVALVCAHKLGVFVFVTKVKP
jgi:hypothetical protein